jgi:hypothetical protein
MYRHMRISCVVQKKNEEEKQSIYVKLLEHQEKSNSKLANLEKENTMMRNKLEKLENTVSKCTKTPKQKITSNVHTNNGNINNGVQNIILIGYGKEDMSQIDRSDILKGYKDGFYSTLELTDTVHFNPKYPEYHNVYISSMKNKYAMMYDGTDWNLVKKNVLIDKIYSKNKNYIEENLDDFYDSLTKSQIKALNRWTDIEDDTDKRIREIKESIKMLLYNKRDISIKTRKDHSNTLLI